jgi:ABC-type glutathione transport system ATPase component
MSGITAQASHLRRILCVEELTIGTAAHILVKNLTFTVGAGERLGIVGESGSGKTMTAHAVAGLLPAEVSVLSGDIRLEGRSVRDLAATERRALAGGRIGMVLQERLSSFNPVRTIGSILIESAMRHRAVTAANARCLAIDALTSVRLPDAQKLVDAYPHQLSGGQLQRAMIALARMNDPILLIADEPTTALDPTVQLQVLSLLQASAADRALVLITHDLSIAAAMCDRLLVMHRGECVEQGPAREIMERPQHAYTRQLLVAVRSLAWSGALSSRSVSNL